METIQSTSNQTIKNLSKLHQKKYRDQSGEYLIEGKHLIKEAMQARVLKHVYSLEPFECGCPNTLCSQAVLNKLSAQNSDARLVGVCEKKEADIHDKERILVLNDVQDPGNLGTLLRSAYAFGFPSVVLSPGCADVYNPKTIQSSQGALFHVHVEKADIEPWILEARSGGYTVYATALQAYSIFLSEIRFPQKFALVLGNEGTGLPQTTIALCDACIKIEMSAFESLNVAIAGSICMYEALVQRSK